jgi:hypothetical protein
LTCPSAFRRLISQIQARSSDENPGTRRDFHFYPCSTCELAHRIGAGAAGECLIDGEVTP